MEGFPPSPAATDTKRKEGGRGLVSFRATIQDETTKIQEYIRKNSGELLSECLRLLKPGKRKESPWKDFM